jgi:Saccharopine dehydrogenase NADP binding domain
MTARVLVIGAGDLGGRLLHGLAATGRVGELVLAGRDATRGAELVGLARSCAPVCRFRFAQVDGTAQAQLEDLIGDTRPDLVVQCASLLSPWALDGRDDARAHAMRAAFAAALPLQLPIVHTTMRAAREVGYDGPVANLSFPDATNVVLGRLGLAPTLGLGNASMIALRVRAVLRERLGAGADLPLVRVVAQHAQVFGVMRAEPPSDPADRVRVFVGEDGERADELAYVGHPLPRGIALNQPTAAAAVEAIGTLLPGAAPARLSVPGPLGLPGGFPVRIDAGTVSLDLPAGQAFDDALRYAERMARGDGIEAIAADGTVTFTAAAQDSFRTVAPWATAPLHPDEAVERAARLRDLLETTS